MNAYEALMEWHWRGTTEVLGGKQVPAPLYSSEIPHGLAWDRSRTSALIGCWLTAWTIAQSRCTHRINFFSYVTKRETSGKTLCCA